MKGLLLPMALAAVVALGALLALEILRPAPPLTAAQQALQIAGELRCPDCQSLSVAESETAAAAAIRRQIIDLLAAGRTPEQVRRHFTERYGEWILLSPRWPLAWWLPVAAVLFGTAVLGWWLLRGRATAPAVGAAAPAVAAAAPPASDDLRARIRDELEELDA